MTTLVVLDGAMGDLFGREWDLHITSPVDALRIIDANNPDFLRWVRENLNTYEGYSVTCTYSNGVEAQISEQELLIDGEIEKLRFTPIVMGSGSNEIKLIVGIVILIAVTYVTLGTGTPGAALTLFGSKMAASIAVTTATAIGVGLTMQGITGMMASTPSQNKGKDTKSYYFNGAENTEGQGFPVPLIYGKRVLVGSHAISLDVSVNNIPIG